MVRIYLASPLGFADSTRHFMEHLIECIAPHVDVSNPWDDQRFADEFVRIASIDSRAEASAALAAINTELGRANAQSIREADGVVAILDGVDVDSGTAAEVGYAYALGKRIFGLRTDFRLAGDNPGSIVNLQVQYFIEASGGSVQTTVDGLMDALALWVRSEPGVSISGS
jgi:nucleoside 2-deoxyribosyltransferase